MKKVNEVDAPSALGTYERNAELLSKAICNYIAHCRTLKGVSRTKFAVIGNFGEKNMRRIEYGEADPRLSTAIRAALYLEIPVEQFFYDALTKGLEILREQSK